MTIGEVSHCTPSIKAIKLALLSIFLPIWYTKWVETLLIGQNSPGMHGNVCVYVWNGSFKGQNVLSISFRFFSLIGVKFWEKCDIFFKITCVNFTYIILQ